jgi:RNA polymerase sigma factor (sigma-70 family)
MALSNVAHGDDVEPGLLEDADVVEALTCGDRGRALTLLMTRHGERVYRYAVAMTNDYQLADEIRQQVFVDAYRDLETFEARSHIRAWLFGIARHRCLDAAKSKRRWNRRYKQEAPAHEVAHDGHPDRDLDRNYLAKLVAICLQKLAPAAHEAIVLRYHQELSYTEVASLVGERAGTVQQRVARALPVLRKCIDAQLGSGGGVR